MWTLLIYHPPPSWNKTVSVTQFAQASHHIESHVVCTRPIEYFDTCSTKIGIVVSCPSSSWSLFRWPVYGYEQYTSGVPHVATIPSFKKVINHGRGMQSNATIANEGMTICIHSMPNSCTTSRRQTRWILCDLHISAFNAWYRIKSLVLGVLNMAPYILLWNA